LGGIRIKKLTTLLFAFLILALISGIGTAAEIFVKPGSSIQTALDSSTSGDIITVKPGTYTENLKVSKDNLTIRSESGNPDNTIIKARSTGANVLLLQGNNIKINGFEISGATRSPYAGINLSSCSNCIIENNKLLNNMRGVYLLRSNGNTVSKNNVANSGEYGIALQGSTGNTISGNTASDNQRGVYLGTSDENIISSNIVQSNSVYGFFICGLSDKNRIYNNYFNNTNMTIRNGIGNAYNTTKTAGTNIVGGPYIGGNFWGKPDETGFSQTAVDGDGDGISDSAYTNMTGSAYSDYLPLVTPGPASIHPVADFSINVTSGIAPLNVGFTDNSTGAPTSWAWDFGDGNTSKDQNPVHTYYLAGNYSVNLTVSNENGTDSKLATITVSEKPVPVIPVADFSANVTEGYAPLSVQFNDSSENATSVNWDFGDGSNSGDRNPVHEFTNPGIYTVNLTATNENGTDSKLATITVSEKPVPVIPVADFSANVTEGYAPLSVQFTDLSENATSVNWDFGDGNNSTEKNPIHTYSAAGNYTVNLTVSNENGTASKLATINVSTRSVLPVFPGYNNPPTDPDQDGLDEDVNGNGILDFDDVVAYYDNMDWIEENLPLDLFDYNSNGLIDFDDVVKLYDML